MAMRRDVLERTGGFDERFRWYRTADIELSFRVNDLGPVLSFVGKLGNPVLGGVELSDFVERQAIPKHQLLCEAV